LQLADGGWGVAVDKLPVASCRSINAIQIHVLFQYSLSAIPDLSLNTSHKIHSRFEQHKLVFRHGGRKGQKFQVCNYHAADEMWNFGGASYDASDVIT